MPYIGRDLRTGAFRQLDDISSGFDGSDTTHTMQVNSTNVSVGDVNQILLSLGGVIQKPGTDFTVSGSTLTFTTAPAANTSFFAILLGSDNGGTVTPTDGSVTGDKIANDLSISTNVTIATDDNSDTLTLTSTDADASSGPNLRLYRNSSSPADGDDLSTIDFEGRNDNSQDVVYAQIKGLITDASDGTEDGKLELYHMFNGSLAPSLQLTSAGVVINESSNDLDFRVESDDATHMLFVDASTNRVGIGTSSPSSTLDVTDPSGDAQIEIVSASTSNQTYLSFRAGTALHWYFQAQFASGSEVLNVIDYAEGSNNVRMVFGTDGVISGNFNDTSDVSLKKEVTTLSSSDFVKNLNPVSFKWKEDDREDKGFIAQEIEALDSSLVSGKDGQKAINVTGIVAQLTKSLQEAQTKIETLETKVKALEDA